MNCQRCGTGEKLEVCLFCGLAFCSQHRGELDGVPACTGCIQAEHQRKAAPKKAPAAGADAAPAAARKPDEPIRVTVPEKEPPPPPLPEPRSGTVPVLLALGAAAVAGGYLYWLFTWLAQPRWIVLTGTGLGAAFVLASVWVIAKTRMAS